MAEELHVEPDRLRELAAVFDAASRGISGLAVNGNTPSSLAGPATGTACHTGTQSALMGLVVVSDHYRALHRGTLTSAESYETIDAEYSRRLDSLRESL